MEKERIVYHFDFYHLSVMIYQNDFNFIIIIIFYLVFTNISFSC